MNYKNGYKIVYEVAADGERTFYATKSTSYPTRDASGKITDDVLATFNDADFKGKTIYEYEGEFYVSTGALPAYNEDGTPKDKKIAGFEKLFVEEKPAEGEENTEKSEADPTAEAPVAPVAEPEGSDGDEEPPVEDPAE